MFTLNLSFSPALGSIKTNLPNESNAILPVSIACIIIIGNIRLVQSHSAIIMRSLKANRKVDSKAPAKVHQPTPSYPTEP